MLLSDLLDVPGERKKPTLNDLFDVPGELNWSRLDITEVLKSTVPIKWINKTDGGLEGTFEVDGSTYVILLEPGRFQKYRFINVAFYKVGADGKDHYELSLNTKNPAKVLGAIINGIWAKLDEFDYDALIFAAADNVDKRMLFYNKLARRFTKHFPIVATDVKAERGKFTVLIASTVAKADVDAFIEHVRMTVK